MSRQFFEQVPVCRSFPVAVLNLGQVDRGPGVCVVHWRVSGMYTLSEEIKQ